VQHLEQGRHTPISPCAATNPAEFFAVICEYFCTAPGLLHQQAPAVYEQLKAYFRQDPLERIPHGQ
jgi:Mlc titration factor MtfA (ptsG expression regulator)